MRKRRFSGRRPLVLAAVVGTLAPLLGGQALDTTAQATFTNAYECPSSYLEIPEEGAPGVTVCVSTPNLHLIAVDLTEGAKLRVVSERVSGGPDGDAEFRNRSAEEWMEYIQNYEGPTVPTPTALTHVVNAGFLVNSGGDTTPLSLPEMTGEEIQTYGYAGAHWEDPAWTQHSKMTLRLGDPSGEDPQVVHNGMLGDPWTGAYTTNDVYDQFDTYYDATAGFPPGSAPSDGNVDRNRTFVFRDSFDNNGHDMFFILTSLSGVTLAEMNAEVQNVMGGPYWWPQWSIQFDGGRSTQYCSVQSIDPEEHYCGSELLTRDVAEVLAVYSTLDP